MGILRQLQDNHFNTIVRQIKKAATGKVEPIRTATWTHLRRLGVKRDSTKAVEGIPAGSDQWDPMSLVAWMSKIQPVDPDNPQETGDAKAIEQLIAIDATCVARTEG